MIPFLLVALTLGAPDLARGKALFAQRCAVCHGDAGLADGVVAASLTPRPANLTQARFSTERLVAVMREGVPGTTMPAQADLSALDRAALIAFVQSLGPASPPARGDPKPLALGENVFAIRCSACHGMNADGEGQAASRVGRRPTDFTRKQPTKARVVEVLEQGVPGTAMTPMRRLVSDQEVEGLVAFIQSVYGRNLMTGDRAEAER